MSSNDKKPVILTCVDTARGIEQEIPFLAKHFYCAWPHDTNFGYCIINADDEISSAIAHSKMTPLLPDWTLMEGHLITTRNTISFLDELKIPFVGYFSAAQNFAGRPLAITNVLKGPLVKKMLSYLFDTAAKNSDGENRPITTEDCIGSYCKQPLFANYRKARILLPINHG